ncbi:MAG: penicillin acylase family protein [Ignavibacteriales bacterium]|nr:penicillin acylase family protein [Ignavibacteriales bacterium]
MSTKQKEIIKKHILGIVFSIIAFISFFFIFSIIKLNNSLPDYNNEIDISGLKSSVKIYRDSCAIPYIIAENDEDAMFALGYVHAQERMFQMDMFRRAGEGRLSEIFGSQTVFYDKLFKTLGLYKLIKENYNKYSNESKKFLEAYSNGVNAFINKTNGNFPIEFKLLEYEPYKWKPEHSLLILKMMAWQLNISWWTDIVFTHLVQKLGAEKVRDILPDYPENTPTIIPTSISNYPEVALDLIRLDRDFRQFIGFNGTHIGSNNWVINGKKSSSGKPIMANDPHLSLSAPGQWFVVVIKSPQLNAQGFTIPGVPGIVIGNNSDISWALTNIMADDCDFYNEIFDSTGTKYLFNNDWHELKIYRDSIVIKDSLTIDFEIKATHRGPIISEVHTFNKLFPNEYQNKSQMSIKWTALDFSDEQLAMIKLNKAKNWNDFKDGLKHYVAPGQNFIYADKEGNIGYVFGARLPIRGTNNTSFVFDGTTDSDDWKGYVPYDQVPKLFNPTRNFIATANNKTDKNFEYHITNLWEPNSRIEKINELLINKTKHSVQDFMSYQMDFYSNYAKNIVPYILNAFQDFEIKDKNLLLSLELLSKWDFIMHENNQTPLIYSVFYKFLLENIFLDEMGDALFNEYIFVANIPYRVINQLFEKNESSWFDNITTNNFESRDDIIRKSLSEALDYLEKKFGKHIVNWQWGNAHQISFMHTFHGVSDLLNETFDLGHFRIGGDGTTIFLSQYQLNDQFDVILGPSMRYIYDFANPDEFYFILPTGQSGNVLSEHYNDMIDFWLKGKYHKINTNIRTIESGDNDLLILNPKNN